jgi:branched-chain amino acid transport system ATP-binding protein
MGVMLEVKDLKVNYGVINALKGISFKVNKGEIVSLIGANGAGKTTTLHTITGLLDAESGSVSYHYGKDGKEQQAELTKVSGDKIVRMGLAHVPEGRRVFAELTVLQNLKLGAYTRSDKAEIEKTLEEVYERFPRLKERRVQKAGTLSGGEQQMLAMGRALMSKPRLMMLDEPSMGLAPILVDQIFEIIEALNKAGTTILLVEQNAQMALSIADRAYVLETGRIVNSGTGKDLLNDDSVKKAYLGG